ncbi:MAG TPA: hypothetical protein V6D35_21045 [Candidatus Sericytochromatia bacterium]
MNQISQTKSHYSALSTLPYILPEDELEAVIAHELSHIIFPLTPLHKHG